MKRMQFATLAFLLSLMLAAEAKEHKGAQPSQDQATDMSQEREKAGKREGDDGDRDRAAAGDPKARAAPDSDAAGNERGAEMRERRDERKEIREEYQSDREPGQEGDETAQGKKPWWKFWES